MGSRNIAGIRSIPAADQPQILVSCLTVPETNEMLRFGLYEESDYTRMWENYPRRRKPTAGDIVAVADSAAVTGGGIVEEHLESSHPN
jgi:hypothetical protein